MAAVELQASQPDMSWLNNENKAPPQALFPELYKEQQRTGCQIPWDVAGPQPTVVEALDKGYITGTVLDVGCGLGQNAIYLGEAGLSVTAVDYSPEAIALACTRLAAESPQVQQRVKFLEGSALDLKCVLGTQTFDTWLDSAVYHCFSLEDAAQYVRSASPHVKKGGRVVLIAFSTKNPNPWTGPRKISEAELRSHFSPEQGWQVDEVKEVMISHHAHSKYNEGLAFHMVATRL
jgi:SAM-dependent methyltransferase